MAHNGYWEIDIVRAGAYTFDLRRWPREANLGLNDGIEGTPQVDFGEMTYEVRHTGGKALPITAAELEVGGQYQSQQVKKGQLSAKFTMQLEAGSTILRTRLYNDEGFGLGAYYVYIKFEKP